MRVRRSVTALAVLATLGAFTALPTPPAYADSTTETYIVQLKSGVSADKMASKLMGTSAKVIHKVFQGGIVKLNAAQAKALAANPYVASVHKDAVISASVTQTGAPWDLDMLDSPTATLDQTYTSPNNGSGVTVYVLDSGILRTHTEFASATIATGQDFIPSDTTPGDCNGHGTAVSSLITGATLGASKGVTLVPLKVLDCSGGGKESTIISAADWIAANQRPGTPAVANLSFGVSISELNGDTSLEDAFQGLINNGVTVVAAAGNGGVDACTESPASLPDAITVASVNKPHAESSWSNYGSCVDLYAPGESVNVASTTSIYSLATGSGTSFSAPLVAAGAAQVLHDHPMWTPAQVAADISSRATSDVIGGARSANKLLNVTGRFTGTDPTISGAVYAGDTATAVLHWTPTPTSVTYQWHRDGVAIDGATASTYVTTSDDIALPLTVTATTTTAGYLPISGTSTAVVTRLGLLTTAGTPTIAGTAAVGYMLTADPGTWDPADMTLTYQWCRDSAAITNATASTYAPVATDVGHTLTVKVTGSKSGYVTVTAESAPTAVIQGGTSPLAYEAFVKASYQDFLSRQPTSSELAVQSNALSSGTVSVSSYLDKLSTSDEWLTAIVTKMYADTLHRVPDAAGLEGWVAALRSGQWSVAQVASFFYASDEYYQTFAGNSASPWVTQLYQKLLSREPDPAGLAYWVQQTNDPRYGRIWVASNFYQSVESRTRRVEALYQALLFREPDPTGWPYWTGTVFATGDLVLATQIAGSQEYWDKAHVRY